MKKLISILTALALMLGCFPALAEDESAVDYFISQGLTAFEGKSLDSTVTRAEFCEILCSFYGEIDEPPITVDADGTAHVEDGFLDVDPDDKDENILNLDVIKMIIEFTGHGIRATAMGGYPDGYIYVWETAFAEGMDIDYNAPATVGSIASLLNEALDIPWLVVTSFNAADGSTTYALDESRTLRVLLEEE